MRKHVGIFTMCLVLLCVVPVVALAQYIDPEPWVDKWFQGPEMVEEWGYDIMSQYDPYGYAPNQVIMDDWECTDNTWPVKGFRWWGSYFNEYGIENLEGFYISIHDDIPKDLEIPSHPGVRRYEQFFTIGELGTFASGAHELSIGNDSYGTEVFEYYAMFDECFWQDGTPEEPVIYWVNIVAQIHNPDGLLDDEVWGWHTSGKGENHNLDDAVKIWDYDFVNGTYVDEYGIVWEDIRWTEGEGADGESLDMAFEVIPEPSTLLLLIPGLAGLATVIRRRK